LVIFFKNYFAFKIELLERYDTYKEIKGFIKEKGIIMIIDGLTHITKNRVWVYKNYDASLERLLREMSKAQVDKAVLVGNPPLNDNDFVLEVYHKYPNKFIPVAAFNPKGLNDKQIEMEISTFKQQGFMGIKIHPRFCGLSLDSTEIDKVLKIAGKHDLVCFICTLHRPPSAPLKRPLYDVIHEICENNKKTRIVLVHGGYYELLPTSEIIRSYENVLLDLSLTLPRFAGSSIGQDIKFLFNTFEKRIVLGSDFPEYTFSDIYKSLRLLDISVEDFIGVGPFGENLMRFFNINTNSR
jgi:predicted TIM-barrel fold metal-dependent hydrolase